MIVLTIDTCSLYTAATCYCTQHCAQYCVCSHVLGCGGCRTPVLSRKLVSVAAHYVNVAVLTAHADLLAILVRLLDAPVAACGVHRAAFRQYWPSGESLHPGSSSHSSKILTTETLSFAACAHKLQRRRRDNHDHIGTDHKQLSSVLRLIRERDARHASGRERRHRRRLQLERVHHAGLREARQSALLLAVKEEEEDDEINQTL